MDTQGQQVDVKALIEDIKRHMPATYLAIKKRADVNQGTYAQVRKGLRGVENQFYAFEKGRVVGTPFRRCEVTDQIAGQMVDFGCAHVCIWGLEDAA